MLLLYQGLLGGMAALITFVSIATEHDVSGMFGGLAAKLCDRHPRVAIFGQAWCQAF